MIKSDGAWTVSVTVCGLLLLTLSACANPRELSRTPRTPIEQLLISQALARGMAPLTLPLPAGASLVVEPTGLTPDQYFAGQVVATRLAREGFEIGGDAAQVQYRVLVTIEALGTDEFNSFFGMPPVQSVIIPFALPEITIYKHVRRVGLARFSLSVFDRTSGRLITTTPWYEGRTFYTQLSFLLFFQIDSTDLEIPGNPTDWHPATRYVTW